MSSALDFLLNPGDLDEDFWGGDIPFTLDDVDEGLASDVDSQERNGGSGSRSPNDSLFITDTDGQARTLYSRLLSTYPQLGHHPPSSQSSVSVGEDVSMSDVTDSLSQRYPRNETTPNETEVDRVCYGMVRKTLHRTEHLADRVRYP